MSINRVLLLGNVGNDPKVTTTTNSKVANFSLATTERGYTRKDGTKAEPQTEWHNITAWGPLAALIEKHVTKGTQLYIEGRLKTRKYEKDGITRYNTEVQADSLTFVGNKPQQVQQGQQGQQMPPQVQAQQWQQAQAFADQLGNNDPNKPPF